MPALVVVVFIDTGYAGTPISAAYCVVPQYFIGCNVTHCIFQLTIPCHMGAGTGLVLMCVYHSLCLQLAVYAIILF